jgi:hypothetical protein
MTILSFYVPYANHLGIEFVDAPKITLWLLSDSALKAWFLTSCGKVILI